VSGGGRESYRPGEPVVAVRHARLDGNTLLAPGDRVPGWCDARHILPLFRAGLVGMEGCPWVAHQLRWLGVAPAPVLSEVEASAHES